jgi:RHS repeat-associated protein
VFGLTQVLVASDGSLTVTNLFGLDLISQDDGVRTLTLLADGLGSVRTEMTGAIVEATATYEPYGEYLSQQGVSGSVYGFTGEEEDAATGLLYLRARYYEPFSQDVHESRPVGGHGLAAGDAQLLCVCGR